MLALSICLIWALPALAASYADTANHWAEQDIARMSARGLVSGTGGGLFGPEQVLTRQEAVSMLVRLSGMQTGSVYASGWASSSKGVAPWAVGYLDQAVQKGIVNDMEIRGLDWGAPASRAEMAVWLGKTLGMVPVVNDSEGIMSAFKDAWAISSAQVPYIIPLVKNGLMVGSNGCFRPLDGLKRAEAAALLSRADARFPQAGGHKMERGQFVRLDSGYYVTVVVREAAGQEKSLVVTQQTLFYGNGKKISSKNLGAGQMLNYICNGNQLVYAEVAGTNAWSAYTPPVMTNAISVVGEVEEINHSSSLIRVYAGGTQLSYRLSSSLSAGYINARVGDEVALTVVNGWVTGVSVLTTAKNESWSSTPVERERTSQKYTVYKGTLDEVNASNYEIRLTSVSTLDRGRWPTRSGSLRLEVQRGVEIYYDGEPITLRNLAYDHEGDIVYLALDDYNEEVLSIRVKKGSEYNYYDNRVEDITSRRLELEDNDYIYGDDDVIVIEDGKLAYWDDIEEDDEVFVTANYTGGRYYAAVIEILGYGSSSSRTSYTIYRGSVADVDTARDELQLSSVYYLDNGRFRSRSGSLWLEVGNRADIYADGDEIDLEELEDDYDGDTIYAAYDEDRREVRKIRVKDGSEYFWNDTVTRTSSNYFRLKDDSVTVYYEDSTIVIDNDRLVSGAYIDEDDEVSAVAHWDGNRYWAAIVIIE